MVEANAKALGIEFADDAEKAYLNMVARVGKTLLTSGMYRRSRVSWALI